MTSLSLYSMNVCLSAPVRHNSNFTRRIRSPLQQANASNGDVLSKALTTTKSSCRLLPARLPPPMRPSSETSWVMPWLYEKISADPCADHLKFRLLSPRFRGTHWTWPYPPTVTHPNSSLSIHSFIYLIMNVSIVRDVHVACSHSGIRIFVFFCISAEF